MSTHPNFDTDATSKVPSNQDDLPTWLTYLETIHTQSIDLGLTRSNQVAQQVGLLKPAPLIITVGGTNGKGTTCRMIELCLLEAGLKVGVYSSPHLLRYNERVRINGQELPDEAHVSAFDFLEKNRGDTPLTYFEFGTLSALYLFKQAQLDVVILEVGLGGRLDSCNIIDANVSVITSIDIDHIDWLGDNREDIAREKAGIFRKNSPAIIGEPIVPQSMTDVAYSLNTTLYEVGKTWHIVQDKGCWHWHSSDLTLSNLPYPKIPVQNAGTALATLYAAGLLNTGEQRISPEMIIQALKQVSMPGRFQTAQSQSFSIGDEQTQSIEYPKIILDVAHNPHAAKYLAQEVRQLITQLPSIPNIQVHFIVGMLNDKDIINTLRPLVDVAASWHFISLEGSRGAPAKSLAKALDEIMKDSELLPKPVFLLDTLAEALNHIEKHSQKHDIILICGSFYTVAEYLMLQNHCA